MSACCAICPPRWHLRLPPNRSSAARTTAPPRSALGTPAWLDADCGQLVPRPLDDQRIGIEVVANSGARLVDRRTPTSGKRRIIDFQHIEEHLAGLIGKERRPDDLNVDRRVPGAGSPVHDPRKVTVPNQAVALDISVNPDGSASMG